MVGVGILGVPGGSFGWRAAGFNGVARRACPDPSGGKCTLANGALCCSAGFWLPPAGSWRSGRGPHLGGPGRQHRPREVISPPDV